jgi:hypothetical protein
LLPRLQALIPFGDEQPLLRLAVAVMVLVGEEAWGLARNSASASDSTSEKFMSWRRRRRRHRVVRAHGQLRRVVRAEREPEPSDAELGVERVVRTRADATEAGGITMARRHP